MQDAYVYSLRQTQMCQACTGSSGRLKSTADGLRLRERLIAGASNIDHDAFSQLHFSSRSSALSPSVQPTRGTSARGAKYVAKSARLRGDFLNRH